MSADPARLALLRQGQSFAKAEDASVKAEYPGAREQRIGGYFVNEADAIAVNDVVFEILRVPRQSYSVRNRGYVFVDFASTSPNATLTADRFGLDAGEDGIISRLERDILQMIYSVTVYI
ncbi:MAG: hypothetical protein AAGA36_00145 [Pseudomonadota bacterium]